MNRSAAHTGLAWLALALLLAASACAPTTTPPPFIPPAAQALPSPTTQPTPTEAIQPPTVTPASPTAALESPTPAPAPTACSNNLSFVQDITVPDGSLVQPGGTIEKEWLVSNSGTCDWDASYRLNLVGGDALGAASEQALYPARAGSQVVLKITFTAPLAPGSYQSAWQAFAPDGSSFGDAVYLQIVIGNP